MKGKNKQLSFDDVLWPNRFLLKPLGFWPIESINPTIREQIFTKFRAFFSIFMIAGMLVFLQICTIIVCRRDIAIVADVGSVAIEESQLVFKMSYVVARWEKFYEMYQCAKDLWSITNDPNERKNFESLAEMAKRATIILFSAGMSNVFCFILIPIIITVNNYHQANGGVYVHHLPLEIFYSIGIDTQRSPNYEIAFCCQLIAMISSVMGIAGFDATMLTLILHISGQFRLLSARFRAIGNLTSIHSLDFQIRLRKYINHHQVILRLAKEMKELLAPMVFVQLMSSSFEICLCGFMLITGGNSHVDTCKWIIYTLSMFCQLIIWCWPGEVLIRESTALSNTIMHEVPWYKLSARQQRDFRFVMARAQKSCCVTALSFQVMSINKLCEVFNAAVSYCALLRSVSNK